MASVSFYINTGKLDRKGRAPIFTQFDHNKNSRMLKIRFSIFILVFFSHHLVSIVAAQFYYNEDDDIIAYSYVYPKIERLKERNRIPTFILPESKNDTIFWQSYIRRLLRAETDPDFDPNYDDTSLGFRLHKRIKYFDVAKRVKIKEGYVWLYKIICPGAFGIGVRFSLDSLGPNEYVSAHTNYTDSINGPEWYREPEIYTREYQLYDEVLYPKRKGEYGFSLLGHILYLEVYSPNLAIEESNLVISEINYRYEKKPQIKDAPIWIRERYPDFDFDYFNSEYSPK